MRSEHKFYFDPAPGRSEAQVAEFSQNSDGTWSIDMRAVELLNSDGMIKLSAEIMRLGQKSK